MIKLLVTHKNPDLDAITSIWLFRRFDEQRVSQAEYAFVPPGQSIDQSILNEKNIADAEVIHTDTGNGEFDHHQPDNDKRDSAALRVYTYLIDKYEHLNNDDALYRLVDFVNESDHFASFYWPEATSSRYMFMVEEILSGLRSKRHFSDWEMLEFGMVCLDGIYTMFKVRVAAERDLEEKAWEFTSRWGKSVAIENHNDHILDLALKSGNELVVRKDADQGHIRIKAAPDKGIDFNSRL